MVDGRYLRSHVGNEEGVVSKRESCFWSITVKEEREERSEVKGPAD